MTTPTTLLVGDAVHEFTRDRAPFDDPVLATAWRYRWVCSCGSAGNWQTDGERWAQWQWRKHVRKLRERFTSATERPAPPPAPRDAAGRSAGQQ